MNFLDTIRKILKSKKKTIESINQFNLVNYDTSFVFIPEYNELNLEKREKVNEYQKKIDINDLNSLYENSKAIAENGNTITNLLIKHLYQFEEEAPSLKYQNDKTVFEKERIELLLLENKIRILKQELEDLRQDSILRTIALWETLKLENKKIYSFIGLFEQASRIKKQMKKRSLEEAIYQMKIVIKNLDNQITAINNTIVNSSIVIKSIDLYNQISNEDNKSIKEKIYSSKLSGLVNIYSYCFKEKISFENYLTSEKELLNQMAIYLVELDKYIYLNKETIFLNIKTDLEYLETNYVITENRYNKQEFDKKVNEFKEKINEIMCFKYYLTNDDIERLYTLKFRIMTYYEFDNYKFEDLNEEGIEYYKKIIYQELEEFFNKKGDYPNLSRILISGFKIALQRNNQDIALAALENKTFLKTILYVNHPNIYQKAINEMITFELIPLQTTTYIGHLCNLGYDEDVFCAGKKNTFCIDTLVEKLLKKELLNVSNNYSDSIMIFSMISKFLLKYNQVSNKLLLTYLLLSGNYITKTTITGKELDLNEEPYTTLSFADGVTTLTKNNDGVENGQILVFLPNGLNNLVIGKVVLPNSLISIGDNFFFGDYNLKKVNLPDGLKSIGNNAFRNCQKLVVEIPKSVEYIGENAFSCDVQFYDLNIQQKIVRVEKNRRNNLNSKSIK